MAIPRKEDMPRYRILAIIKFFTNLSIGVLPVDYYSYPIRYRKATLTSMISVIVNPGDALSRYLQVR
jgi:hypothetical protein